MLLWNTWCRYPSWHCITLISYSCIYVQVCYFLLTDPRNLTITKQYPSILSLSLSIYTHIPTSCTLIPLSPINAPGKRSSTCTTCNHASGHNRNLAGFASPPHFPVVDISVSCHLLKYRAILLVSFNLPPSEGEEQLCFQALDTTLDPYKQLHLRHLLGSVSPAGYEGVDQKLVSVSCSHVQRGVTILINTVDFPSCRRDFHTV